MAQDGVHVQAGAAPAQDVVNVDIECMGLRAVVLYLAAYVGHFSCVGFDTANGVAWVLIRVASVHAPVNGVVPANGVDEGGVVEAEIGDGCGGTIDGDFDVAIVELKVVTVLRKGDVSADAIAAGNRGG